MGVTAGDLRDAGEYELGPKGEHIFDDSQCDAETLRYLDQQRAKSKAQRKGFAAGKDHHNDLEDNPFPAGTDEHRWWSIGFRGCRKVLRNPGY